MKKILLNFGADAGPSTEPIANACKGLIFISETDADIVPFSGEKAEAVTVEEILRQTGREADEPVEQVDAADFFERLTRIRDWHGDREKERAAGYETLYEQLKLGLNDLHVFRIGNIRIDIYAAGIDGGGLLAGVMTTAVET